MRHWLLAAAGSAVVGLAAFGMLLFFRYQPLATQPDPGFLLVWDRLGGQECVTPRTETTNVTGMACNKQELEALNAQIKRADQLAEKQAADAAAAEAYKQALAIAGGDTALAKKVEVARQAGFSDAEVRAYVSVERIAKANPIMAPRIARARARGASDADILTALQHPPPGHSLSRP